jgi:hypothetical protein
MKNKEEPEMKSEYRFDYKKARPNRFAKAFKKGTSIVNLESDVAEAFPDSESVNEALRFLVRVTKQHKSELPTK